MTSAVGPSSGPLAQIRVLDVSDEKGAYCTRLLADLGADVIKVEPPEGDRLRRMPPFKEGAGPPEGSFVFATYHANKRGVVLDLSAPEGRAEALELAKASNVVVTSFTPAEAERHSLTASDWREANPDLIVCSITAFGLTGPFADYRMTHLTSHAMGGLLFSQGEPTEPPRVIPGIAMYDLAGATAALGIQVALMNLATAGPQLIDVAVHDMLATREWLVTRYASGELIQRRGRAAGGWRCLDGEVEITAAFPRMWQGFVELLGKPPEITAPAWDSPAYRVAHMADVRGVIGGILATRTVDEVVGEAQRLRVPSAPLHTVRSVLADRQLAARGFLIEMERPHVGAFRMPGRPYQMSEPAWSMRRPAPLLGEHDGEVLGKPLEPRAPEAADKPYAALRVLSFGTAIAGNETASLLADLGADVLRVESPQFTERNTPSAFSELKVVTEPTGYKTDHRSNVRSQKGISLEVTNPEGRALFLRLVEKADVVLENNPAGALEKWGIGWEVLSKVNPRIILLQMSGYGQTGPRREYVAFGSNLSAFVGLTHLWRHSNGTHNDYVAAVHGACAVLAAVATRQRTGRGVHIDLAQVESGAALLAPYYAAASVDGRDPEPPGNRVPGSVWSGVYRSSGDDAWIAIDLETEPDWTTFWTVAGQPVTAADARFATTAARAANAVALDAAIEAWTKTLTARTAMHRLQAKGLAAGAVQNAEDIFFDPQLHARGTLVVLDHPDLGRLEYPQSTLRMDKTPSFIRRPKTRFGEYNEEVYGGWLGLTADEMESLRASKAI